MANDATKPQRGPAADADRNEDGSDRRTQGGQQQEKVEDQPNVGTTTPDAYPDKAKGSNL